MKFRNFLGVANTAQQAYFKEGVEMLYPSIGSVLKLAILPAYDPMDPKPTGWIPAVNDFVLEPEDVRLERRRSL